MLLADVLIACALDLIFGDPYWLPHPVRFIGWLISKTEKLLRKHIEQRHDVVQMPRESGVRRRYTKFKKKAPADAGEKARLERRAGLALMLVVVAAAFLAVFLILEAARAISPVLFHILNIYFIYTSLAARCLAVEAKKVYAAVKSGDLSLGRKQLAMLVGRQTEELGEKEIVRGVVETTAENTVDGVLSPLLYAFVGSFLGLGAPLVYAFKAVSTLDSMVGYRNEKYINLGRISAKTDDAANWIPARLSGIFIPLAALVCGKSFTGSFRIMLRDRRNHKSPNCAYPEAAVAGALGIQIGGTNVYFGQAVVKPTIGDARKELEADDIKDTIRLMYAAELLVILAAAAVSAAVLLWFV